MSFDLYKKKMDFTPSSSLWIEIPLYIRVADGRQPSFLVFTVRVLLICYTFAQDDPRFAQNLRVPLRIDELRSKFQIFAQNGWVFAQTWISGLSM
ncbi:hypothetical protein [Fictibacillus phosphorivorans]|uniref:hypothetical protein n=1 Tax=Fictibacillus phosphorivorans TaxID=1221500 RepID=UPI00204031A1|nr:hypothetical protein [Fictibacillus phosphorivorans]MCM3719719.1 hypothetical protein [Fictibacillus phosphorivorans]MCM3777483.1 hypothetical protein [Fictibacillus phosphorivorans]